MKLKDLLAATGVAALAYLIGMGGISFLTIVSNIYGPRGLGYVLVAMALAVAWLVAYAIMTSSSDDEEVIEPLKPARPVGRPSARPVRKKR